MAKVRAGKVAPKNILGDVEADEILHAYKAAKKINYMRKHSDRWKLAAASSVDRFLLIGQPAR